MNISKITSNSFKGMLIIQHQKGINCFDAKNIEKVVVNGKKRGVSIQGEEIDGAHTRMHIPYYAISQDEILEAYKFARSVDKVAVIIKINDKCHVKSR